MQETKMKAKNFRILQVQSCQAREQYGAFVLMQSVVETTFLAGPDPLAALTSNLNQHITAEAFKPRAPAPWETNAFQTPDTIPEGETVEYGDQLEDMYRTESYAAEPGQEYAGLSHPYLSDCVS